MICSTCGNEITSGKFCNKCGAWVSDSGPQFTSDTTPPPDVQEATDFRGPESAPQTPEMMYQPPEPEIPQQSFETPEMTYQTPEVRYQAPEMKYQPQAADYQPVLSFDLPEPPAAPAPPMPFAPPPVQEPLFQTPIPQAPQFQSYQPEPPSQQFQSAAQQFQPQQFQPQQPSYRSQPTGFQPQPGYASQQSYNQQQAPGFPPQQGYNQQPGYPQQQSFNQQPGYPQPQQQSFNQPPQGYPQPPQAYNQPPQPGYAPPPPPAYNPPIYQPGYPQTAGAPSPGGSFIELVQKYGGSPLFLIAIILYSAGSIISQVMNFSAFSIFSLAFAILPIIAFWMIFGASKSPRLPERTLTSLTIFKVIIIIGLVMICLVFLLVIVLFIIMIAAANYAGGSSAFSEIGDATGILAALGIGMLIFFAIALVIVIIYYRSVLVAIGSIKKGIINNSFSPLRGVGAFSVFSYIGLGFSIISTLSMMASTSLINNSFDYILNNGMFENGIPDEVYGYLAPFLDALPRNLLVSNIALLVMMVGTILCIVVLNQLSRSIKYKTY